MCHSTASSDQGSLAVDGSSTGNGAQKVDFSVAVYSGAEHVINSMQVPLEGAFTLVNFVEWGYLNVSETWGFIQTCMREHRK